MNRCESRRIWSRGIGVVLAALLLQAGTAHGAIEGISYTLQPTYSFMQWDSGVPLKNTELYGGRVAINFGRYVSLAPYYLMRGNVRADFSRVGLPDGLVAVSGQRIDLRNYGANVVLSTGGTNVAPFLRGGAGVMEFRPDGGGHRSQQINVNAGGGVRFGLSRLLLEVYAEDTAFRLNRYQLSGLNGLVDPGADRIRHNLAFGGSVNFKLGGNDDAELSVTDRAVAERYRNGLRGLSIPIELFGGRLDFGASRGLKHQNLAGLRTGLDFGPYFGLRAFYWRGMNDNYDDTARMQSYGGEARFNLASGQGAIPYLVVGAGQVDFMNGYRDEADSARADRSVLILGGGVAIGLGDRLHVNVGARNNLMTDHDIKDIASADELRSNWAFSAGLGFNLFGGGQDDTAELDRKDQDDRRDGRRGDAVWIADRPMDRDDAAWAEGERPGRGARQRRWAAADDSAGLADGAMWREHRAMMRREMRERMGEAARPGDMDEFDANGAPLRRFAGTPNYAGERMVTFPVPKEGEVYVRYGKSTTHEMSPLGGSGSDRSEVSQEAIRSAIREELGRLNAPGAEGTGSLTDPQQMELMERRIMERLNQQREAAPRENGWTPPAPPRAEPPAAITPSEPVPEPRAQVRPAEPAWSDTPPVTAPGSGVQGVRLYIGDNVSSPNQFVGGIRVRLGGPNSDAQLNVLPEIAVGNASGSSSFLVAGNLQVDLKRPDAVSRLGYYTYAGLGFLRTSAKDSALDHSGFVLNLGVGAEYQLMPTVPFFVELQGVDLFDQTRLLVGLRYRK